MFYLVNKPMHVSSHQAIRDFAKLVKATKVGHAGTLDPFATGLLLVATDEDTPLLSYADRASKTYLVAMRLGAFSSTQDATGVITTVSPVLVSDEQVIAALRNLTLLKTQVPPAFSAKQVNGQRAYKLARAGQELTLAPIAITVFSVSAITKLNAQDWSFSVTVSRGTYVRTLVHDVGLALKCGAYTLSLTRTSIGEFSLDLLQGVPYLALATRHVITLPPLLLKDFSDLVHGKQLPCGLLPGEYALVASDDVVGVAQVAKGLISVKRLLGSKLIKEHDGR